MGGGGGHDETGVNSIPKQMNRHIQYSRGYDVVEVMIQWGGGDVGAGANSISKKKDVRYSRGMV